MDNLEFMFQTFIIFAEFFTSKMVVASAASPFCTWLVAACMTVSSENKYFNNFSKEIERQKRLSRSVRRGYLVALSNKIGGINSLMKEYCSSHRLSSSCTLFGESAFAVLGSKNRGRNQLTQACDSGKFFIPNADLVLDQFGRAVLCIIISTEFENRNLKKDCQTFEFILSHANNSYLKLKLKFTLHLHENCTSVKSASPLHQTRRNP